MFVDYFFMLYVKFSGFVGWDDGCARGQPHKAERRTTAIDKPAGPQWARRGGSDSSVMKQTDKSRREYP